MHNRLQVDCLIIGAGIAGLWLVNRLQQAGYSALLLEHNAIGCGQTIASQGIIHGGTKYALTGSLSQTGQAVADMPQLWRDCIQGTGEIDLAGVNILSEHQYLWSTQSLTSRIATFLGSKTLQSRVHRLQHAQFPPAFQYPSFKGQVYQLQEIVLDVPSVLSKLAANAHPYILHVKQSHLDVAADHTVQSCQVQLLNGDRLEIQAQRYILTAGAGNEALLNDSAPLTPMQRRPLHMAIVKHRYAIPLYAHCMIAQPKPRVTITTHYTKAGQTVWYLGGLLAENGVQQTEAQLINTVRAELKDLFPWLDFTTADISGYRIDRAEPAQLNGHLPGNTYVKALDNRLIAWPTKLAMAPKLAADVLQQLCSQQIKPQYKLAPELLYTQPKPPIATPIWEY